MTSRLLLLIAILYSVLGAPALARRGVLPQATPSSVASYAVAPDKLVATAGGAELWNIPFMSAAAKYTRVQLLGPITLGQTMYLAYGPYLLAVDGTAGRVTQRWRFPAAITKLAADGDQLQLAMKSAAGADLARTFSPADPGPPQVTTDHLPLLYLMRTDTDLLLPKFKALVLDPEERKLKDKDALAEEATRVYGAASLHDPTNPWYVIALGRAAADLGRDGEALALYHKALEVPGLVFYDFTQMSNYFEAVGARALADQAFTLGLKDFLSRGYEPELLQSMIAYMTYNNGLKQAGARLKRMDPDRMLAVQERLFQLAPWPEGAFQAYAGTARYLDQQGRISVARPWWERSRQAVAHSFMGVNATLLRLDLLINLLLGLGIAFGIWALILGLKYRRLPDDRADRLHHALFLLTGRYLAKTELLANLALAVLAGATVVGITVQMSLLGNVVRAPLAFLSGTIGTPDSVRYLESQVPGPARNFVLALAYQQSGDAVKAAEMYGKLPDSARSHNNLGVLSWQAGAAAAARREYEAALKRDPKLVEARYNLGQGVTAPRAELQARYAPGRPLLALPGGQDYRQALSVGNMNFLAAIQTLAPQFGVESAADTFVYALLLTCYVFFLLTSLTALVMPRLGTHSQSLLGNRWWGGLLLPGLAPQWTVVGPVLMALWFGAIVTLYFRGRYGALGVASGLAMPAWPPDITLGFYPRPAFSDEWLKKVELSMIGIWVVNVIWLCLARLVLGAGRAATEEDLTQEPTTSTWDLEELQKLK